MKKIFVCSQFKGDVLKNRERVQHYCRLVALRGFLPIAPHAYFTYFLSDAVVGERELGMAYSAALLEQCDAMLVVKLVGLISDGMALEMQLAKGGLIPVWEIDVLDTTDENREVRDSAINVGLDCLTEIMERRSR